MKKILLILTVSYFSILNILGQINKPGSGECLDFNGMTDFVNCGNTLNNVALPFTVEGWINTNVANTRQGIVCSDNGVGSYSGFWCEIKPNGVIGIGFGDGTAIGGSGRRNFNSTYVVPANEWVHFSCVVNTTTSAQIYINGVSVPLVMEGSGGNMVHGAKQFQLAQKVHDGNGVTTWNFDGKIDEVRVWNSARTQNEVREYMSQKLQGNEAGLVGYWRMDEGADNTCAGGEDVCDATGNGNNGIKF